MRKRSTGILKRERRFFFLFQITEKISFRYARAIPLVFCPFSYWRYALVNVNNEWPAIVHTHRHTRANKSPGLHITDSIEVEVIGNANTCSHDVTERKIQTGMYMFKEPKEEEEEYGMNSRRKEEGKKKKKKKTGQVNATGYQRCMSKFPFTVFEETNVTQRTQTTRYAPYKNTLLMPSPSTIFVSRLFFTERPVLRSRYVSFKRKPLYIS